MRMLASQLAAAVGGTLDGPDVTIEGASFDSREVVPGQLFVPIVAARDGHEFVPSAVEAGAVSYLSSAGRLEAVDVTAIHVADTSDALLAAGRWARQQFEGRLSAVVGITGSVGKTSTKDLAAAAIGAGRPVSANVRSFNNHLGLPVTIMNAPDATEVLVLEMGMNDVGEIARLCDIAQPTVSVVTAVGAAHTGPLGGIEGVARAKREIVDALRPGGTAILNADDERVAAMRPVAGVGTIRYGTVPDADIQVTDVQLDELARPRFRIRTPWGTFAVELAVSGEHMAMNAAAALAIAGVVGVPLDQAAAALSSVSLSAKRMQLERAASGALVVNDAYNANPTSMRAALRALAAIDARRRVAVLGLMAELDDPPAAHVEMAAVARELGIELVAVGTDLYGIDPVDDAVGAVGPLGPGDAVLVKGSLVAGLGPVAAALVAPVA